jgi:hypothetical protein
MIEADATEAGRRRRVFTAVIALALTAIAIASAVAPAAGDQAVSATAPSSDPVSQLQQRLDAGQAKLDFDSDHGYLASVLKQLNIPVDSQMLVFSKTSFQQTKISPSNPRALYFDDNTYIGWVNGGDVLEIASVDPRQGPVFYVLNQKKTDRPRFVRETSACLQCHQSSLTGDLPGLLMRSVYPDANGMPILTAGTFVTTDQSPLKERWGGWYMDGSLAKQPTMGNGVAEDSGQPEKLAGAGVCEFSKRFEISAYLGHHSDVIALAVLAHQTHLHNLMTRAAYDTRAAVRDERAMNEVLGQQPTGPTLTTVNRIKAACEPLVQALLFSGEASLGEMAGSSDFVKHFESLGPRDHQGRSLGDFDLHARLFRYPCSYLIYSDSFDALPDAAREYVYRRLWEVLTGRDDAREFSHLRDSDRDAIYDILRETKQGLPTYWKPR